MSRISHVKKGDQVVALSGSALGQTGKVLEVSHKLGVIKVEGLGVTKRHSKPSQTNPKGGIVEGLRWWPASKFMVSDDSGKPKGRSGSTGTGKDKKRTFSGAKK